MICALQPVPVQQLLLAALDKTVTLMKRSVIQITHSAQAEFHVHHAIMEPVYLLLL